MNWIHRQPFRNQFKSMAAKNKRLVPRALNFNNQPIDAVRLQLADHQQENQEKNPKLFHFVNERCPVHHEQQKRNRQAIEPTFKTFSDHQSSIRQSRSSIHSISTIQTDFVHQRVSTIHTFPSSNNSIIDDEQIIDDQQEIEEIPIEQNQNRLPIEHQNVDLRHDETENEKVVEKSSIESSPDECHSCQLLIDIIDQQTDQIRQYTEQISRQAELFAKLARSFTDIQYRSKE